VLATTWRPGARPSTASRRSVRSSSTRTSGLNPTAAAACCFVTSVGIHYRHDSPYTISVQRSCTLAKSASSARGPARRAVALWAATQRLLPLGARRRVRAHAARLSRRGSSFHAHLDESATSPPFRPNSTSFVWIPREDGCRVVCPRAGNFRKRREAGLHLA
jgi:hypothetical protein